MGSCRARPGVHVTRQPTAKKAPAPSTLRSMQWTASAGQSSGRRVERGRGRRAVARSARRVGHPMQFSTSRPHKHYPHLFSTPPPRAAPCATLSQSPRSGFRSARLRAANRRRPHPANAGESGCALKAYFLLVRNRRNLPGFLNPPSIATDANSGKIEKWFMVGAAVIEGDASHGLRILWGWAAWLLLVGEGGPRGGRGEGEVCGFLP
jgi:hypothetical protein